MGMETDRTDIPITDAEAQVTYYLLCLKEKAKQFDMLFKYFA